MIGAGHPMMIDLAAFADTDTLDICFWTDTGTQMEKWDHILKDPENNLLGRFTNPIDPGIKDSNHEWHKGYISYRVEYLKNLCREKKIKTIIVQFEFADARYKASYSGINICIISLP